MKKKIMTLVLSLSFVFVCASFVKAETLLPDTNSARMSNKSATKALISKKLKELKAICKATKNFHCTQELVTLVLINQSYMNVCGSYYENCNYSYIETLLLRAAADYEGCLSRGFSISKNIDRNIYLKKRIRKESIPIV